MARRVASKGIGLSLDLGVGWERPGCCLKICIATGVVLISTDISAYSLLVHGAISEDFPWVFGLVMAVCLDDLNAIQLSD